MAALHHKTLTARSGTRAVMAAWVVLAGGAALLAHGQGTRQVALFLTAAALGIALYHALVRVYLGVA